MKAAPTVSGNPIRVAPMPEGFVMLPQPQVAQLGGYSSVSAMDADTDAPRLHGGVSVGGVMQFDSVEVRYWLVNLAKWREGEPARREREHQQAKERHEAAMRERHEEFQAELQRGREQKQMFRESEARREAEQAAAARPGQAIILDANGRLSK